MKRIPKGAPKKGSPAKGSWGDQYIIEKKPYISSRVSCATCKHYSESDKSCNVSPIIPYLDGYNSWKRCDNFYPASESLNNEVKEKIKRVKGKDFFFEDKNKTNNLSDRKNKANKQNKPNEEKTDPPKFVLDDKIFLSFEKIKNDIIILSLKKRIPLEVLLIDCELEMQEDSRISHMKKFENHCKFTSIERYIIFLELLCSKLDCTLKDVINFSEAEEEKILSKIIKITIPSFSEIQYENESNYDIILEGMCKYEELFDHENPEDSFPDFYHLNIIKSVYNNQSDYTIEIYSSFGSPKHKNKNYDFMNHNYCLPGLRYVYNLPCAKKFFDEIIQKEKIDLPSLIKEQKNY